MVLTGRVHVTLGAALCLLLCLGLAVAAFAHGVPQGDKGFIQESHGVRLLPFTYLGAKHMVTGYDHLLFLLGVIFFLYRMRDVSIYVTLFAAGHTITLLSGVLFRVAVNAYAIDAIIGLSVVYKALDNMGAYQRWFGFQPNTKAAILLFGHGSVWPRRSRTSRSRRMVCSPTSLPSTWGWSSGNSSRWEAS